MTARKRKHKAQAAAPRERIGRSRQRQRLIDACIAALHIHGPSRTTVEKVVAIARMSPGIVRFYFDSKAAMLVASLKFLAAEFEERVMVPVGNLKATPVAALQLLVDLYLDPEIASPRKVSVWYAFWGEASSRQEYYDICGRKDESSATLVRELIEALIVETSQPHLDADGIALGLIGVLEVLWQDIAFQTERDIDRVRARRRAIAFLQSVFPGCFAPVPVPAPASVRDAAGPAHSTSGDPGDPAFVNDALFRGAWTIVGHEAQIPRAGDFLAADIGVESVLVVRGGAGQVHAMRNRCPASPHALVGGPRGRFGRSIECTLHGLAFRLDGRTVEAGGRSNLVTLDLLSVGGLLFVKRPVVAGSAPTSHRPPTGA